MLEKWQNRALRHIARAFYSFYDLRRKRRGSVSTNICKSPVHLKNARKTSEGDLHAHGHVHAASSEVTLGAYPVDKRTGAGEAMRAMVYGRL